MQADVQTAPVSKTAFWAGWVVSALPVLMLLMSGVMKLLKPEPVVEGFSKLGWNENLALGLGILELVCTVVYLIPQTAVFGAILLTGSLGGAYAAPVLCGWPFFSSVI